MLRNPVVCILMSLCSCSIIQDSDITSSNQANSRLHTTSIAISQTTSSGNSATTITPGLEKSIIPTGSAGSGPTTVLTDMSAPQFGTNSKMKFRGGTVPTGAKMFVTYNSNGAPATFGVYKENLVNGAVKDSTYYEFYRFRYDNSGRLAKMVTFLNPSTVFANDTLLYTNNRVSSIIRKSSGGLTKTGTVTIEYNGNSSVLTFMKFESSSGTFSYNQNGCYTCVTSSNSSLNYSLNFNSGSSGSGSASLGVTVNSLSNKLQMLVLEDQFNSNNNGNGGGASTNPGTYYFHPLMLLHTQMPSGISIFQIYMFDWWQPGSIQTGSGSNSQRSNETVNFTFNYVVK